MITPAPKVTGLTDAEIGKLPFARLALVLEFKDPEPRPNTPVVYRAFFVPRKEDEASIAPNTESRWSHRYSL